MCIGYRSELLQRFNISLSYEVVIQKAKEIELRLYIKAEDLDRYRASVQPDKLIEMIGQIQQQSVCPKQLGKSLSQSLCISSLLVFHDYNDEWKSLVK